MLNEVNSRNDTGTSGSFLFANNITYSPEVDGTLMIGVFHYVYNRPDAIAAAIGDGVLNGDFKTNRLDPLDSRRFFSGYNPFDDSAPIIRAAVEVVAACAAWSVLALCYRHRRWEQRDFPSGATPVPVGLPPRA